MFRTKVRFLPTFFQQINRAVLFPMDFCFVSFLFSLSDRYDFTKVSSTNGMELLYIRL